MFAKVLSISDELMWRWYTLLSLRSEARSRGCGRGRAGRNPKDAKVLLAQGDHRPLPRRRGGAAAQRTSSARRAAACPTTSRRRAGRRAAGHRRAAQAGRPGAVHQRGLRLVEQGGVRIDGAVVSDKGLKLAAGTYVVQVGKRKFARVTLAA
jgi:tyrosyl-tRNA synthetase